MEEEKENSELRDFLATMYNASGKSENLEELTDNEIKELASNLSAGVPFATPVFDGASEEEIMGMLKLAYPEHLVNKISLSDSRTQVKLFDGRTGEAFDRPVTIGYMHMLKLHHLVDDKMHARSTGPYSLVTQQPLEERLNLEGKDLVRWRFGHLRRMGRPIPCKKCLP